MRRKRRRRSHQNAERWLVSYADFITLLFAFFVVMYSTAQVDQRKVGQLAMAIQVAFQEMGVFPASTTKIPVSSRQPMPFSTVQAIENVNRTAELGRIVSPPINALSSVEQDGDLSGLRRELEQTLAPEIARHEVALRAVPDGLVVSLREIGFFESGSAALKTDSRSAFDRIAELLAKRPYRIRVEGHTDNVPIHNGQFASNWELSTARASEVVRLLIVRYGFAPERLSAAGYAQYHPVAENDTAAGRAQNRRVDIVILGKLPPEPVPAFLQPLPGVPDAARP
jgi:chemotaxis protein MotB